MLLDVLLTAKPASFAIVGPGPIRTAYRLLIPSTVVGVQEERQGGDHLDWSSSVSFLPPGRCICFLLR